MTFTVLSLFFIPCFRWNKRFYVRTACCGQVYELDPQKGRRIARGEAVEIVPGDLRALYQSRQPVWKRCERCGFSTQEDFEYCPKCGSKFLKG